MIQEGCVRPSAQVWILLALDSFPLFISCTNMHTNMSSKSKAVLSVPVSLLWIPFFRPLFDLCLYLVWVIQCLQVILWLFHIIFAGSLLVSFQAFLSQQASCSTLVSDIYKVIWDVGHLVLGYDARFVIAALPGCGVIGLVWKPLLTVCWLKCWGGSRQFSSQGSTVVTVPISNLWRCVLCCLWYVHWD